MRGKVGEGELVRTLSFYSDRHISGSWLQIG